MPPPAKKKRKTTAGSIPVDTRRTTRSQRPGLSIEMIGKVATFAQYDDGDLMNICLAVGRKDATFVRHTCLRNNLGYLEHCLKIHSGRDLSNYLPSDMESKISCWMEVNTDWRKLCTKERTEDNELSTPRYKNEEGGIVYRTDPLIIFNNPAVAIEFGIIDVLKHLVEEVGIDINACKWSGLIAVDRKYLLLFTSMAIAEVTKRPSCFNYLISLRDINVSLTTTESSHKPVWCFAYTSRCSSKIFRAVVEHSSFDANRPFESTRHAMRSPLSYAFMRATRNSNPGDRQKTRGKFKVLLDVGADPELGTDITRSPLDFAKNVIRGAIDRRDERFNVLIEEGTKLVQLMEEKVASRAPR